MRRSRISKRAISKRAGPACAAGAPTWWNNVQGLSPCDVYQAVLDKCGYVAPALIGDEAYYPVSQAETCMCNTITYNLGSACQDCQRGTTDQGMAFSAYLAGGDFCETQSTNLPDLAVPTEDIPLWAYLDTSTQFWTYGSAQEIALNSTTTIPPTTSTPVSSNAPMDPTPILTLSDPNSSPTETPVSSTSKSTNAGAIGGGVAGGVVAILAVIGLLLFLRRRRARGSHDGPDTPMATAGGPGRNGSVSSESSLTESGKVAGSTSHSHYTPHSQMAQLNHNGSKLTCGSTDLGSTFTVTSGGVHIPMHSTSSALTTPIDAPPVPTLPHEYTPSTPARSLAASPTPSAPAVQKVKRVPVRYSEDELAQAEEEAKRAAQHQP